MPYKPKTHTQLMKESSPFAGFYAREKQEQAKLYDKERGTSHTRGYGSRWRQASKGYLVKHPLCFDCEQANRTEPATLVHHIKPVSTHPEAFWTRENWVGLCVSCHSKRHKELERG